MLAARSTLLAGLVCGVLADTEAEPSFLILPQDHFADGGPTWSLKFWQNATYFSPGGPLLLMMPDEAARTGCSCEALEAQRLCAGLGALVVCAEHRFFGSSVPGGSSSVERLSRLHRVEQNLADQVALVLHVQALTRVSGVVAYGGSYAGASSAWIRHRYPEVIDAAIARSPPVVPRIAFPEYDTSNLVALASPDYRCADAMARVAEALDRQLESNRTALMTLFNAEYYLTSDVGDGDFMYGVGDATYRDVQYGGKANLCSALRPLYGRQASDIEYTELYATYALARNGEDFLSGCWYNSTCMRESASSVPTESARSWYWLKCTELGYFQVAPASGRAARPRGFSVDQALAQCRYIFPGASLISEDSIAAFNAKFGGAALGGTERIFEINFSDDPWKMATSLPFVNREGWCLGPEQPFLYLTCDGCGHMGYGLSSEQLAGMYDQILAALRGWGIPAQASDNASFSGVVGFV